MFWQNTKLASFKDAAADVGLTQADVDAAMARLQRFAPYIQKVFPPLTMKIEGTEHWLGENGIMFAIVTFIFGVYFWRKAIKEKL